VIRLLKRWRLQVLVVLAALGGLGGGGIWLEGVKRAPVLYRYKLFLQHDYLPEVRRATGQWPSSLDGVPAFQSERFDMDEIRRTHSWARPQLRVLGVTTGTWTGEIRFDSPLGKTYRFESRFAH
jgi:hypothetical protein